MVITMTVTIMLLSNNNCDVNRSSFCCSSVALLLEQSPGGGVSTLARVSSVHLFRYTSNFDNFVLACEVRHRLIYRYITKAKRLILKSIKILRTGYYALQKAVECKFPLFRQLIRLEI